MKNLFVTALILLPAGLFAQQRYVINGSLGTYNSPAKVYLQYDAGGKTITDSVALKHGKFSFKGTFIGDPKEAYLEFSKTGAGAGFGDFKGIYLEKGTIRVIAADSLKRATVSGTKTNEDNARYEALMKPVDDAFNALDVKWKADTANVNERANNEEKKALLARASNLNKQFVKDNPGSFISVLALERYANGNEYPDIKPLFDKLSPRIKATKMAKEFGGRLPRLKAIEMGAIAPNFAQADTAGKMISLSSFRGKYVLIDFWASWCHPCRRENPNILKAFNQYKAKNFTVLGVSLDGKDEGVKTWLAAIHSDGLNWTQVCDFKAWDNGAAQLYVVQGIPQNFLIDPQGKIIAKDLHGDDLQAKLAEVLGK